MSRRARFALATCAAIVFARVPSADDSPPGTLGSWTLLRSEAGRFQARLPAEPIRSEEVRKTWLGRMRELRFHSELPGAEFAVEVHDLPRGARWIVGDEYIFEQAKDGLLRGGARPELGDEKISRSGHEGRRIRYELPERDGWVEEVLIFLGHRRLYLVRAGRARAAEADLPIEAFFQSFEFW